MRRCALIFFVIMIANHCFGMDMIPLEQQHIIVLNGTTTAGKTSMALQLKKQLEQKSFSVEILGIDTFVVPKVQWALLANTPKIWRSDWIDQEEMEEIGKASQIELCNAAKTAYEKGKVVIIDAPIYRPDQVNFYQEALDGLKVTWVLVYCPISTLVKRVIDRNEKSGSTEQRSILQALNQFSHFYTSEVVNAIDILSADTLFSVLNKAQDEHVIIQDKLWDFLKSIQHAICPFDFETIKQRLLEKISFKREEKVMLGSVVFHDCFVNTAEDSPEGCAEGIMNALFKKI